MGECLVSPLVAQEIGHSEGNEVWRRDTLVHNSPLLGSYASPLPFRIQGGEPVKEFDPLTPELGGLGPALSACEWTYYNCTRKALLISLLVRQIFVGIKVYCMS